MAYPTTLDAFPTRNNSVDIIYAEHINDLQTAMAAIQAMLGVEPFKSITLDDDQATSWTPGRAQGVVIMYTRDGTATVGTVAGYKVGAGCFLTGVITAGATELTTGALTGTTGTDAKVTLSVHTDGKLYLENRLGSGPKYFGVVRLGQ